MEGVFIEEASNKCYSNSKVNYSTFNWQATIGLCITRSIIIEMAATTCMYIASLVVKVFCQIIVIVINCNIISIL